MRSAIVTGATSFIGHALVKELLRRKVRVYAVIRPQSQHKDIMKDCPDVLALPIPVEEIQQLAHTDVKAECFFSLAWGGNNPSDRKSEAIQRQNVALTMQSLEAAAALGCKKFLFVGSQAEYGDAGSIYREDAVCQPSTAYGEAKLEILREAERIARPKSIDYVHARIFSVYGPGDHAWTLVSQVLRALSTGKEVALGECCQPWNYLYIDDAVDALIALAQGALSDANPAYNIASQDTRPLRDFVEEIRSIIGGAGKVLYGAIPSPSQSSGIAPDISKLLRAVDWRPRTAFCHGIQKTLAESSAQYQEAHV